MQRSDWSRIAHAGMEIMNPIPPDKVDDALDALGHLGGARAIDLGCGKGDLLARLSDRYVTGVGVDLSRELLDEARERVPGCDFMEADVTTFEATERFDVAAGVGSPATLAQLAALVDPGGRVVYGAGYWRREPTPAYLEALGAERDDMSDYAGTIREGEELGLMPLYATTASTDDFDRYEWRWSLNGERYAAAHPEEPGVAEFLAFIRNGRRRYVELGGRETLGFGLFLFART